MLSNTLIAGGSTPGATGTENCPHGSITMAANDYNIEDRNQCSLDTAHTDRANATVDLGPLQDNGGPTRTMALLPGSPAIDGGDPGNCQTATGDRLGFDQRGVPRTSPTDPRCDVGAFELGTSDMAITTGRRCP